VTGAARLLCAAATVALFAAGAAYPLAARGEGAPQQLTIAFTGDVIGYLEPCG
jgi:hypothetical protein